YLSILTGQKAKSIEEKFYQHHYLMDPLMPGEKGRVKFTDFGEMKDLNSDSGPGVGEIVAVASLAATIVFAPLAIFSLIKWKKQTRTPRYLRGPSKGSYKDIYSFFDKRIKDFYENMKIDKK